MSGPRRAGGPGRGVGGQRQPAGDPVQVRGPPGQVGLPAPVDLPAAPGHVVGEHHAQRRQLRWPAGARVPVGAGQVGVEQGLGAHVEDRAVPGEGQDVVVGGEPVEAQPPQPVGRVEAGARQRGEAVRQVVVDVLHRQRYRTGRLHDAGREPAAGRCRFLT